MTAVVASYTSIIAKAYDGRLKLPAFQRKWVWKPGQVALLFDSLRQGFPIGSFLFMGESAEIDLRPRTFVGASPNAESKVTESVVLDGQQRITAGLELFFGQGQNHYFIDIDRLYDLFRQNKRSLKSDSDIQSFLDSLDIDADYLVSRKSTPDPRQFLIKNHRLYTGYLINEKELARALQEYKDAYPDRSDFTSLVVGTNFRPSDDNPIPVTNIDSNVTLEGVTRIFTTLNRTGKLLTPFDLVVCLLYPIDLPEDVKVARDLFPYYARIDESGELLLQTIALLSNKNTKKALLPKTIKKDIYEAHKDIAAGYLDKAAQMLSRQVGLGLDASSAFGCLRSHLRAYGLPYEAARRGEGIRAATCHCGAETCTMVHWRGLGWPIPV